MGPGPGTGFTPIGRCHTPRKWDFLHNDWLQLAFELGIPALLLAVVSAITILRKSLIPWGACMAALMVNALGGFPFHLAPLGFLFVVALAMGVSDNEVTPER